MNDYIWTEYDSGKIHVGMTLNFLTSQLSLVDVFVKKINRTA